MTAMLPIAGEPVPIVAPKAIVAHAIPGTGSRLVVSCSGPGSPFSKIPAPEFVDAAPMGGTAHALFLSDPARSWMNGDGVAQAMVDTITRYCDEQGIEEVVTIGQSMGGFAALVLPDLLPVTTAIAFSPQFSMDPAKVPEETRWRGYAERIDTWRFDCVGPLRADGTAYVIVHGANPVEAVHWLRFPHRGGKFDHFILAGQSHNIAPLLAKRQILPRVLRMAVQGKRRGVRVALEKTFLDRRFTVRRRPSFQLEHPELTLAEGGAPMTYPEADQ